MDAELIVACLRRYKMHCRDADTKRQAEQRPLRAISFAEMMVEQSPDERVTELLEDPIRSALRGKVREIGWRLFLSTGDTDAMQEVAVQVEDLMPEAPTFAGSILDKWWDGVGTTAESVGWVA